MLNKQSRQYTIKELPNNKYQVLEQTADNRIVELIVADLDNFEFKLKTRGDKMGLTGFQLARRNAEKNKGKSTGKAKAKKVPTRQELMKSQQKMTANQGKKAKEEEVPYGVDVADSPPTETTNGELDLEPKKDEQKTKATKPTGSTKTKSTGKAK